MSLIDVFWENMSHANFSFAIDGKYDMMSLNPLEMTNFEMMGTIFGVGGVLLTLLLSRLNKSKHLADEFSASTTEEDAVEQYP